MSLRTASSAFPSAHAPSNISLLISISGVGRAVGLRGVSRVAGHRSRRRLQGRLTKRSISIRGVERKAGNPDTGPGWEPALGEIGPVDRIHPLVAFPEMGQINSRHDDMIEAEAERILRR